MDINELESFKLSDAVSFHEELNPKLWEDEKLDPEVRDQLMLIAEDFVEYLGISNLKVRDVTISGSNAAYSYTPHSDLDLHVLVDFNELPNNEVYQELFTAKKTLYNEAHDITVRDVPVELYVQDTSNPVQSLGEYSIVHDKWIRIPKKRRANFDEVATKAKYEKLGDLIELAIKSRDPKRVNDTIALVKRYRKSGLDKAGEFGPENLAYKAVRKQGLVQALHDLKAELHGEKLSIEEDADKQAATLKIQKHLNKKYGANLDLDGKLGPLTLKSINKFMPRAKTGLADEPNKTTAVQGKKLKEAPRTLQSQVTPLEKLVQDYGYLTTFGMSHLDKQGATPEAQQQLLALVQRMSKDGKTFANLDKQKMESNRDTILSHIHSMMQYAIPVLKKNLPADKWDAKRSQINGVLTAYHNARQTNEASVNKKHSALKSSVSFNAIYMCEGMHYSKDMLLEQVLYENFLSSATQFLGQKANQTIANVKGQINDTINAGIVIKDIVSNPQLLTNTTSQIRKWTNQLVRDITTKMQQVGQQLNAPQLTEKLIAAWKFISSKVTEFGSSDGWKGFLGSLGIYGFVKFINEMIQNLPTLKATIQGGALDALLGKAKELGTSVLGNITMPGFLAIFDKLTTVKKYFLDVLTQVKDKFGSISVPGTAQFSKGVQLEASGYIPSEKEKNDPRFKTALTVDVRPDAIKKNAKAFGFKTSRAGIPPQARPDGKIK